MRRGRVIVYDRRGCTRSKRPDPYDTTTGGQHADDAAGLLEALDAVPAVVIVRSYGGEVAVDLVQRYPGARHELIGGGHLFSPTVPVVLDFLDDVLCRRLVPSKYAHKMVHRPAGATPTNE